MFSPRSIRSGSRARIATFLALRRILRGCLIPDGNNHYVCRGTSAPVRNGYGGRDLPPDPGWNLPPDRPRGSLNGHPRGGVLESVSQLVTVRIDCQDTAGIRIPLKAGVLYPFDRRGNVSDLPPQCQVLAPNLAVERGYGDGNHVIPLQRPLDPGCPTGGRTVFLPGVFENDLVSVRIAARHLDSQGIAWSEYLRDEFHRPDLGRRIGPGTNSDIRRSNLPGLALPGGRWDRGLAKRRPFLIRCDSGGMGDALFSRTGNNEEQGDSEDRRISPLLQYWYSTDNFTLSEAFTEFSVNSSMV